jgi:hypothetical protein
MDENPLIVQKVTELPAPEPLSAPEPPYVTGGPPFPPYPTDDHKHGISILDYFAAHIMAGLCGRSDLTIDDLKTSGAQDAYWLAALMVDVRGKLPIEPTPVPPAEGVEEEMISGIEAVRRDVEAKLGRKMRAVEL